MRLVGNWNRAVSRVFVNSQRQLSPKTSTIGSYVSQRTFEKQNLLKTYSPISSYTNQQQNQNNQSGNSWKNSNLLSVGALALATTASLVASYSNKEDTQSNLLSQFIGNKVIHTVTINTISPIGSGDELCIAVKSGNIDTVKKISQKKNFDINAKHTLGWRAIHVAAAQGNHEAIQLLISLGADIDAEDEYSLSKESDRIEALRIRYHEFSSLIRGEANTLGFTALHYAVLSENEKAIKLLLQAGANPSKKDSQGFVPLDYATPQQKRSLMKTFEEYQLEFLEKKKQKEKELRKKFPLEQVLKSKIVGQEGAINSVAASIRRKENGWHDEDHPLVFLFLGSSGIGKTELAKQLAHYIHKDNKDAFIRIDMSEFQTKHEVAKFIGSPPGYVGFEEGGQLTEKLRKCPDAVVLLDEVEKAHPDVLTIMLQLFDEGRLTDGKGSTVECKQAIFIMTSNLAQREIADAGESLRKEYSQTNALGQKPQDYATSYTRKFSDEVIYTILRGHFKRDEFLGRINEILFFLPFDEKELKLIVTKQLEKWAQKAYDRHKITLTWTNDVVDSLTKGYNIRYGARSIQHEVEKRVVNQLAKYHEMDELVESSEVQLYLDENGTISFRINKAKKKGFF